MRGLRNVCGGLSYGIWTALRLQPVRRSLFEICTVAPHFVGNAPDRPAIGGCSSTGWRSDTGSLFSRGMSFTAMDFYFEPFMWQPSISAFGVTLAGLFEICRLVCM
jgi:hypothetical protein